jgi:hypothetical protein
MEISANRAIVEGTVTDAFSGNPVEDAAVRAGENYLRTTNAEGFYRMSLRGDSTWQMGASAYGYETEFTDLIVNVGDTITQNFSLDRLPSGILSGLVTAGDSIPVLGATVEFLNVPLPVMFTNALGEFSRSVPGDSSYQLRFRYHDVLVNTSVIVPLGGESNLEIYLDSPRSLAEGPDVYGYYAYDLLDDSLAPSFDWIEITPSLGGPGQGGLPAGNDRSMVLAMPFPFEFYGESFDTLTVNENGWISPSTSSLGFFSNGSIPGASGPSGMLAIFWDNLFHVNDAEVSWWYDEPNGRLVIEYYRMRVSAQSETIGLELQLNTVYGSHTWQIADSSAIRITTSALGSITGMVSGHPALEDYSEVVVTVADLESNAGPSESFQFEYEIRVRSSSRIQRPSSNS